MLQIQRPPPSLGIPTTATAHLVSRCAAEIAPEKISWLWQGRIARGKHTCVAGVPGTGKRQLSRRAGLDVSIMSLAHSSRLTRDLFLGSFKSVFKTLSEAHLGGLIETDLFPISRSGSPDARRHRRIVLVRGLGRSPTRALETLLPRHQWHLSRARLSPLPRGFVADHQYRPSCTGGVEHRRRPLAADPRRPARKEFQASATGGGCDACEFRDSPAPSCPRYASAPVSRAGSRCNHSSASSSVMIVLLPTLRARNRLCLISS
jgi:hypothetical protein